MKNAILMVAAMGMFGGALAGSFVSGTPTNPATTTVDQPVSVTVSNICTYAVPDMHDTNGYVFTQDKKVLTNYTALNPSTGTIGMGAFYIFRCTAGTSWDTASYNKTGDIMLDGKTGNAFNSGSKLKVGYVIDAAPVSNQAESDTPYGGGDIHSAGVTFTAPAGQWNSQAGTYEGKLSVTITYN